MPTTEETPLIQQTNNETKQNNNKNRDETIFSSDQRQQQRKQQHTMNIAEININNKTETVDQSTTLLLHTNGHNSIVHKQQHNGREIKDFKFSKLSNRKKYTLALCTTAMTLVCCAFSLLGPFFPVEAEKKGMSTFLSGIVFGVFELVIFVTAPFYGNYLTTLGPKFVYVAGIFVGGVCNILFGTLDKCPDGTQFIVMTLLCRSVEGIGFSGFITASFAIVASEFPDHIGLTFGILETGSGVGFMIGPLLGGALYELGGFSLPFYAAGVLILLNAVLVYNFLPDIETVPNKRRGSMFSLIKSPMVFIPMLCVFSGVLGITAFDSTMAKHLEPFELSTGVIGIVFGLVALMYSLMSPIWGYLTDTKDIQAPLIIAGLFFFGVAYLLMGPSVLFPGLPYELWVLCIGLGIMGLSFGLTLVPTMKCMVKGAVEVGFENNIDTYSLVSGLFNSIQTLAGFAGPVAIGAIVQSYGYPIAYTVIGLFSWLMVIVSSTYFGIRALQTNRSQLGDKSSRIFFKSL